MTLRDLQRMHAGLIAATAFGPGETIEFAETPASTPVEVRAVINRIGFVPDGETDTVVERTRIAIPNQSELGITAVPDGSRVRFPRREGEAAIWWRLVDVVSSDAGWWVLDAEAAE